MKICFGEIHAKLNEAMQIAKAAEACAKAGSLDQGVEISMDMDQLLYDAGRLHDAICLMNRIEETDRRRLSWLSPCFRRGLSQWQHMMLSLMTGEPNGQSQIQKSKVSEESCEQTRSPDASKT